MSLVDEGDIRRVLIIAYYFPPMGLSGVQRTAKFAKYLTRYGWLPTVLTVEPAGYYAFDESLLKEVEAAGVKVVRTRSVDANRLFKKKGVVSLPSETLRKFLAFWGDFFFIPDTKIGWKKRALSAGRQILKSESFDAILATAPPQTDFLIGMELANEHDIPLLLDFRDAWVGYPFKYVVTPLHAWLHRRLERKVMHRADKVVVTHRRMKEQLLKRYGKFSYRDISILSQGYDAEDFAGPNVHPSGEGLTIVHAGTFYGDRTPEILFKALSLLFLRRPEVRSLISLKFVGAVRSQDKRSARRWEVSDNVTFEGYKEHAAAVNAIHTADVLWYVNDNDLSAPGKLYEYFATGHTILASIVEGYTKQLIIESGGGLCVPLEDTAGLIRAIEQLLDMKRNRALPKVPKPFAEKFERFRLTGELAKYLEGMVAVDKGIVTRVPERSA